MKQRARASVLFQNPNILLMDKSSAGLDAHIRGMHYNKILRSYQKLI